MTPITKPWLGIISILLVYYNRMGNGFQIGMMSSSHPTLSRISANISPRSIAPSRSSLYSVSSSSSSSLLSTSKNYSHTLPYNENSLQGCVCVVTGASRGIGKGIALELGAAGATVYITGTSSNNNSNNNNSGENPVSKYTTNENVGGPGTIETTAQEINDMQGAGVGVPYYCDHSDDKQVKALFEHIQSTHGRLDILVNNVFRVPNGGTKALFGNFWENESSIESWDAVHTIGLRSHYVATKYALPVMIQNEPKTRGDMKRPFIAMISSFGGLCYTFNVAYGVGKAGVDRLTKDIAYELNNAKLDINIMSFYPGMVLTERTEESVRKGTWDDEVGIPLDNAETPRFTGRAIISVATDRTLSHDNIKSSSSSSTKKSGSFQVVAELAQEYGFKDENGNQPPSIRSLKFLLPTYGMDEETRKKVPSWLIPDWKLPFFIMANGAPPPSDDN